MHRVPTAAMIAVPLTVSQCHGQFHSSRLRLADKVAMNMTEMAATQGYAARLIMTNIAYSNSTSKCTESLSRDFLILALYSQLTRSKFLGTMSYSAEEDLVM